MQEILICLMRAFQNSRGASHMILKTLRSSHDSAHGRAQSHQRDRRNASQLCRHPARLRHRLVKRWLRVFREGIDAPHVWVALEPVRVLPAVEKCPPVLDRDTPRASLARRLRLPPCRQQQLRAADPAHLPRAGRRLPRFRIGEGSDGGAATLALICREPHDGVRQIAHSLKVVETRSDVRGVLRLPLARAFLRIDPDKVKARWLDIGWHVKGCAGTAPEANHRRPEPDVASHAERGARIQVDHDIWVATQEVVGVELRRAAAQKDHLGVAARDANRLERWLQGHPESCVRIVQFRVRRVV